jgi:hypothetical protein
MPFYCRQTICRHLLFLVTKDYSDRLLGRIGTSQASSEVCLVKRPRPGIRDSAKSDDVRGIRFALALQRHG